LGATATALSLVGAGARFWPSKSWHSAMCFSVSALSAGVIAVALRKNSRKRPMASSHRLFCSKQRA
jgi:Na+/alanine symporter